MGAIPAKRGRGRPRGSFRTERTICYRVRFTPALYAQLQSQSLRVGLKSTEFVRRAIAHACRACAAADAIGRVTPDEGGGKTKG